MLCQEFQCQKDGIQRPLLGEIDKSKVLDEFALDIVTSATLFLSLYMLQPMAERLASVARKLEQKGLIVVEPGESYAEAALDYMESECI
ncbi:hypothetical protein FZI27_20235 [Cronobacter sakazakii]|nr:hypothetical protein FZI27_20235 [Cronobacter sakazakii]